MAPDHRRKLTTFAIVLFPIGLWLLAVYLSTGVAPARLTIAYLHRLVLATPEHQVLYIPPIGGVALAVAFGLWLRRRYRTDGFDGAGFTRFIRGTRVVTIKKLRRMSRERTRKQVTIAGVPIPTDIENLHLCIPGATGSGKSVLMRELAYTAMLRRDRMVIVDPNGEMLSKFFRPGIDHVLNPYDERTEGWVFYNEVRADYDWKRFALSIVPPNEDKNVEEWNDYGRLLLRETAKKLYSMGITDIKELFRWCTIIDDKDLKKFLTGTDAESLFAGSAQGSKALTSARFVLSNKLSEHQSMPMGNFSIRDWIDNPKRGNLYITWRQDMGAAMKPLITTWTDVFITSILSLSEPKRDWLSWFKRLRALLGGEKYHRPRWWLLIDELASMNKLPSLEDGLTKGRKNGLCIAAGMQSVSQLADIYGRLAAQTIRSCFRNLVVLGGSKTDPETAEEMSKSLGEHEVERPEYSVSRSDGSRNTTDRLERKEERVVIAAEITVMPELTGYIAFAGDRPIAKCKLQIIDFKERNPAFIESDRIKLVKPANQTLFQNTGT